VILLFNGEQYFKQLCEVLLHSTGTATRYDGITSAAVKADEQ
jgi:hypothetical protein